MTRHEHRLAGCRPEPLGRYLKALGVLRLVAEQVDPSTTGHWSADGFVLRTELDDEALRRFFLHDYRPTPIVSPWNSSSGFGPEGAGELHAIEASDDARLAPFRRAAQVARLLLAEGAEEAWSKERMLQECRSRLPEECLKWLDAAAVLTDARAVYPPLLGTGGNDGRLEFSRNFHQRVLDVLGLPARRGSDRAGWLEDALWNVGVANGMRSSPGQFDAGAAGGANSSGTGAATAVLNPWDWVLLLEGSVLFASGSARRLAHQAAGRAAAPFTVEASAIGYASAAADERSRGELWVPLWSRPTGIAELARVFGEAKADWRGAHAGSGLDLAKAASSLGVDRGIEAFSRHVFVERFGLSTVAVPVGRVRVTDRRPVAVLAELDRWLERVRRTGNQPVGVRQALMRVDQVTFEFTRRGRPEQLLRVLVEVAGLEAAVARSTGFRERAGVRPLSRLHGRSWLEALALDSMPPEVRLAACLASVRDESSGPGPGVLRSLLCPVLSGARLEWSQGPPPVQGFGTRPVTQVLADALARRAITAGRGADTDEQPGVSLFAAQGLFASLGDAADLVWGRLDEVLLGEALGALLLLDWPTSGPAPQSSTGSVPPALAILAPFFSAPETSSNASGWDLMLRATPLVPEKGWPAALAQGRLDAVLPTALSRLAIAGLQPISRDARQMAAGTTSSTSRRLAAALHLRFSYRDRARLLSCVCPDPHLTDESSDSSTEGESVAAP